MGLEKGMENVFWSFKNMEKLARSKTSGVSTLKKQQKTGVVSIESTIICNHGSRQQIHMSGHIIRNTFAHVHSCCSLMP